MLKTITNNIIEMAKKTAKTVKAVAKKASPKKSSPQDEVKAEAKKWASFSKSNKIKAKFFSVYGGRVHRASDGKAYSSPEEFVADGGDWNAIFVADHLVNS